MLPLKNFTSRGEVTRPQCSAIMRHGGLCTRRSGWTSAPAWAAPFAARRCDRISTAASEASDGVTGPVVTIAVPYRVQFGEVLRVVGSSPLLGDWSAERGLQLTWTDGDVWTTEVPISAGHYEFKCVIYNTQTKAVSRWEDGGNRMLDIPGEPGKWKVSCQWSATSDMKQTFTPVQSAPTPAATTQAADESIAEEASGEVSTDGASSGQQLSTTMALEEAAEDKQSLEVTQEEAASAAGASAAAGAASTAVSAPAGPSGGSLLLLATCAAGALAAAAALLVPGGLNTAATVSGRATGEAVAQSSLNQAQLRSQLTALVGQVSNMPPGLQTQVSAVQGSVAEGISSLQPMVQNGAAFLQSQATAMQAKTGMEATADVAVAVPVEDGRVV